MNSKQATKAVEKAQAAVATLEAERAEILAERAMLANKLASFPLPSDRKEAASQSAVARELSTDIAALDRLIQSLDNRIDAARVSVAEAEQAHAAAMLAELKDSEAKQLAELETVLTDLHSRNESLRETQNAISYTYGGQLALNVAPGLYGNVDGTLKRFEEARRIKPSKLDSERATRETVVERAKSWLSAVETEPDNGRKLDRVADARQSLQAAERRLAELN